MRNKNIISTKDNTNIENSTNTFDITDNTSTITEESNTIIESIEDTAIEINPEVEKKNTEFLDNLKQPVMFEYDQNKVITNPNAPKETKAIINEISDQEIREKLNNDIKNYNMNKSSKLSMKSTKDEMLKYAALHDIVVDPNLTKAEILKILNK